MTRKKTSIPKESALPLPMFKTAELMSKLTGIGENTIRLMMDKNEIDFIKLGNRRLIADAAMWDWYERTKVNAGSLESEAV